MRDLLRRYVLHDFGLKIISLALAIGLWFVVARDPVAEVSVDVPIEFHNIKEQFEVHLETVARSRVHVRGPERTVRQLQPYDVRAIIDLAGAGLGEHTYDVTSDQVLRPHGLEFIEAVPNQFHVNITERPAAGH